MSRPKQTDAFVMPGRSSTWEGGLHMRGPSTPERSSGALRGAPLFERGSSSSDHSGDEQPGKMPEDRVEVRGATSPVEEEAEAMFPPPLLSEAALLTGVPLPRDAQFRLEGAFSPEQLHSLRAKLEQEGRAGLRLEYLDGDIYVTTTALARHVIAVVNLMVALTLVLRRQELGQVLTDFTTFLGERDELVPDLLVLLQRDLPRLTEKGLVGPASIVTEVLSPSTAYLDRGYKLNKYLSAGVLEYWLVDPVKREIHIYTPTHRGLHWSAPHRVISGDELLTTVLVPGFSLPMPGVFERTFVHVDPAAAEIARALELQVKQFQQQAELEKAQRLAEASRAQQLEAQAQAMQEQLDDAQRRLEQEKAQHLAQRSHAREVEARLEQEKAQHLAQLTHAREIEARLEQEKAQHLAQLTHAREMALQLEATQQQLQSLLAEVERLRLTSTP